MSAAALHRQIGQLRGMLDQDREVIRTFYDELRLLGVLPDGVFLWDGDGARRLARGVVAKARESK